MNGSPPSRALIHKYARLLQDCTKSKDLIHGMRLHAPLHEMGIDSGLFVGNTVVYMYARCGCLQDARYTFDNLSEKNSFSWTAMISAYAEHGEAAEAICLYQMMLESGLMLDKYVFLSILKACIASRCLIVGMWVHARVIISRFEFDLFVANMLIDMYAKCWYMDDAQQVFGLLHNPDIVSWNIIMTGCLYQGLHEETFANYLQMQNVGMRPNNITYMLALKACAGCASLINGRKVHVQVRGSCYEPDISMLNTLVDMYAKGGDLESASIVFDQMSQKDTATWNVMISGYVEEGLVMEAISLFTSMTERGFEPDEVTFSTILKACMHSTTVEHGQYIHFQLIRNGLEVDVAARCALIEMYIKCGNHIDAWYLFGNLTIRDPATWNAMIMGYAWIGLVEKSFALFEQLLVEGNFPDKMTVISILRACLGLSVPDHSKGNHVLAMGMGFLSDLSVGNAVLELYVDIGCLEDAWQALAKMHTRDVVSWNTIIVASIQQGFGEDAMFLFSQMLQDEVKPNHITYSSILKVCGSLSDLEWGMEIHSSANISACECAISVGSALVDMYSKCGAIDEAFRVFDSMGERQLVAWTAIIAGCALQGFYRESIRLLVKMLDEGIRPDAVTFVAVLSSCSRAGLLQEGCYYFLLMNSMYCEVLTAEHVACMVDLLARTGHLQGAKNFLLSMPVEVDAVVWMVLLDACRIHGDVEMGSYACKWTLSLDAGCAQAYVVLSNIYALAGMWDNVSKIREQMKNAIT